MTSVDYLKELLAGGKPRPGHFMMPLIKQFCSIQCGKPYGAYSQDYRILTDCQLSLAERWPIDAFNVLGYPYREACDCGLAVEFPDDAQPTAKGVLVDRLEDLDCLYWPRPEDGRRMSDRIHAIRRFKEVRPDMVAMGAVEAPFAQACTFLGIERAMTAFFDDPGLLRGVMDWIEPRAIQFSLAQIEAGADMMFLGDSLASQIGATWYRDFVRDSEIRVTSAIQDHGVPVKLHICGNIQPILGEVAAVGARFVDIDFPVDLPAACAAIITGCPGAYVVGNFHPVQYLLQGAPEDVLRVCTECEAQTKGFNNFILAPGCEVPPHTPPGNYQAMIEFGWKRRENES